MRRGRMSNFIKPRAEKASKPGREKKSHPVNVTDSARYGKGGESYDRRDRINVKSSRTGTIVRAGKE